MIRTVAGALRDAAEQFPDQPYVRCGRDWVTFGQLDASSDRLAAGLAELGIRPGDRVATLIPNRHEVVELFFACAKLGAVQVPLNYWLKGEFLRYQLADCGATGFVADALGYEAASSLLDTTDVQVVISLDDPVGTTPTRLNASFADLASSGAAVPDREVRPSDLFAILYTSGTTGMPKGCMIPNGYYVGCARANADADWVRRTDRIFTAFPLFHMSGQNALTTALVNHASVCFDLEFSASQYIRNAVEAQATVLMGVGPQAMMILAQPPTDADRGAAFRMAMFVPLPEAFQAEFESRFCTTVIAEGYGQTECSPVTSSSLHEERRRSTAGRAVQHVEIRIVDDDDCAVPPGTIGEIVVRPREADVVFQGYWNKPEATLDAWRNLWHHTGDAGRLDEDGYLTFVDRRTDSIRRRGENISSFEVEAAIVQHPALAQVAITAVRSPLGEDDVKATIVLADATDLDVSALYDFFVDRLPYFAIPRYLEVREALPSNAIGRITKHVLRDEGVTANTLDLAALGYAVPKQQRRGA